MVFRSVARSMKVETLIVGTGGTNISLQQKPEPSERGRRLEQTFQELLAFGELAEKNGGGLGRAGEETGRHS
jgi:hypothetical protein